MDVQPLESLQPGQPLLFGGDRVTHVDPRLAAAFSAGDALVVLQDTGEILHLPEADRVAARTAVEAATAAFAAMGEIDDDRLDAFYTAFADHLEDEERFAPIAAANADDVAAARDRGRSTTRLVLTDRMRADMVAGLRNWTRIPSPRGRVLDTLDHDGWTLEQVSDRLGVVAFVFEGRPNVFADACGVLRGGNTVVFRIGSDALRTARAIVMHALDPALEVAGLPPGAASLVDAPSHAAGWALFADPRLALAVARGSGEAVRQLSAVAQQAGNAVSAHGTGGAWLVATSDADAERFAAAVRHSLDRKVCNTLNVCCIARDRAEDLVPVFLDALDRAAAERDANAKLHVLRSSLAFVPDERFAAEVAIERATGTAQEPWAQPLDDADLGTEWEWENSPEVSLVVVDDLDHAVSLFNRHSPRFVLSVLSSHPADLDRAWRLAEAPYVGDGFTRWVDGQYALGTPELGLSNWELGRLFGRSGILSGAAIHTVRSRVRQHDPDLHR
ncbi:aldehyde dehydrogenase family protein [Egicoccus sp. AB-alg6-2]|uniref:aldehyde dehydrogenase family protein n=1 Tax=Egicoccus sp. AB-alg6-2 TaxID=3242692 RepID=UPI00359E8A59